MSGDRIFLWGLTAFASASLIAAYAPSANVLIAARAFLAVGASAMMPATLSLLRLTFTSDKDRGQAIGIWAAVFSGGVAIGPLIGGALLSHFWWGSVFLINVPVVVMALIFTPFIVPAGKGNPERQLDLLNSLLAMVAMVSMVYALMEVARPGAGLLGATFAGVIGMTVMVIFVRRQNRSPDPMIDFSLFGNGRLTAGVFTAMIATLAATGVQLVLTQRLQLVIGYSPLHAALFMLPIPFSAFVAGSLNGFVLHKVGIGRALWTSLIVAATGLIGYAAVAFLIAHRKSRQDRLIIREEGAGVETAPCLDLSFVGEPWWPFVVPETQPKEEPTHVSRRWFELCTITEVMRELKSGDLCIPGSDRYSDFREQFVSEEEYLKNLISYGERSGVPTEPKAFVAALQDKLGEAARNADREFPKNEDLRIEKGRSDTEATPALGRSRRSSVI